MRAGIGTPGSSAEAFGAAVDFEAVAPGEADQGCAGGVAEVEGKGARCGHRHGDRNADSQALDDEVEARASRQHGDRLRQIGLFGWLVRRRSEDPGGRSRRSARLTSAPFRRRISVPGAGRPV